VAAAASIQGFADYPVDPERGDGQAQFGGCFLFQREFRPGREAKVAQGEYFHQVPK